ncbi:hypothetical protein ACFX2I_025549 [Malus domestica]
MARGFLPVGGGITRQELVQVYVNLPVLLESEINKQASASQLKGDQRTPCYELGMCDMDEIVKIAWVPPELGDAVACVCADETLSLWEEVAEDAQPLQWKLCTSFNSGLAQLLDTQFGVSPVGLKMVTAYSDARVKFYELMNPLELKNWQLQAEFQSVIDSAHQRWLPVAELASPGDNGD